MNALKKNIIICQIIMVAWLVVGAEFSLAETSVLVSPPLINLIPREIGNNEIWYIGGAAAAPGADVIIYLQSQTGEIFNFFAKTNEKGEWFYTHPTFLKEGVYKSWAQLKVGGELSPPSPEVSFEIALTAFRIGNLRLSLETLYLFLALIMLAVLFGGVIFAAYHFRHYHRKNSELMKEIREAEQETKKGFQLLRQDIERELQFISQIKKSRGLSIEEHRLEEKLFTDLDFIENNVIKEIRDIEMAAS